MNNIKDISVHYIIKLVFLALFLWLFSFQSFAQAQSTTMLTTKQQAIIPIAAFAANGDIEKLENALNHGLDAGLSINEAKEILVHTYAYAGFPRALNGLTALMQLLEKRKNDGKIDFLGKEASPILLNRPMVDIGRDIQTEIVGQPVTGPLYDFAPIIDQFLKSHLFGDIFSRDVVDYQSREVATIAILATLSGLEAQLRSHYNIGLNTGLDKQQLYEIVAILRDQVGADVGERAKSVLDQNFAN